MRLMVLGASGMLGHRLFLAAGDRHETVGVARHPIPAPLETANAGAGTLLHGIDLSDGREIDRLFADVRPDAVINAVGLIKQRSNGQDPVAAITVNSLLPHQLAERCRTIGARLVHVSTDCVYSGSRGMYRETDLPDPPDLYGRSKLLGEVSGPGALTLRTSIVGRELSCSLGLLEWFLGQSGNVIDGYRLSRFSGVTTIELANTVMQLLVRPDLDLTGVWHVAGEPVDKCSLLELCRDRLGLDVEIRPVDGPPIDRTLDDSRFRQATGIPKPTWEAMLDAIAADPFPYDEIRSAGS